jgi:hypothetical protein
MNMDNELREALRRKQAPADLADRVLARASEQSERRPAAGFDTGAATAAQPRTSRVVMRWLAAAAVLAVTAGGAERYYTQQRAAEAARVQEEIRIALQITSETLARVQSKLSEPAENGSR